MGGSAAVDSRVLRFSGMAASIGALLWAYKSVAILATGDQPDYLFEIAPLFFGLSVAALVYALRSQLSRPSAVPAALAGIAAVGGTVAAVAYIVDGNDEGLFGPAMLGHVVSMVVLFFLIGGEIRRRGLLPRWSFAPWMLGWFFVLMIPVGGLLSAINERLLEISLLAVVAAWLVLSAATFGRPAAAA